MDDLWGRIKQVEGRTLYTEAKHRPFTVEEVTSAGLTMVPLSSGIRTYSKRAKVERAYQLALARQAQRPGTALKASMLRSASPRNHSYLLAIFRAIGALQ
jgi:hypothetical protein